MSEVTDAADRLEVALADGDCIAGRDVRMWASVTDLRAVIAAARMAEKLFTENYALAAVIEKALGFPADDVKYDGGTLGTRMRRILSTADTASILRERDASKWAEGYLDGALYGVGPLALDNPYRGDA